MRNAGIRVLLIEARCVAGKDKSPDENGLTLSH